MWELNYFHRLGNNIIVFDLMVAKINLFTAINQATMTFTLRLLKCVKVFKLELFFGKGLFVCGKFAVISRMLIRQFPARVDSLEQI